MTLRSGARLVIHDNRDGILRPDAIFTALPTDEHIVFDGQLFIPPTGTLNRRVKGDLGRHALDIGQGNLIHGTLDLSSIGRASTHGCIRVNDEDLRWLYENIPVGTLVVIR